MGDQQGQQSVNEQGGREGRKEGRGGREGGREGMREGGEGKSDLDVIGVDGLYSTVIHGSDLSYMRVCL